MVIGDGELEYPTDPGSPAWMEDEDETAILPAPEIPVTAPAPIAAHATFVGPGSLNVPPQNPLPAPQALAAPQNPLPAPQAPLVAAPQHVLGGTLTMAQSPMSGTVDAPQRHGLSRRLQRLLFLLPRTPGPGLPGRRTPSRNPPCDRWRWRRCWSTSRLSPCVWRR